MTGSWLARAKRNLYVVCGVAIDRRLPWRARLPALFALAYVASPIDLVPDWFPGIGYLDDALVVAAATALTLRCVPSALVADYRTRPSVPSLPRAPALAGDRGRWIYWAMIALGVALALGAAVAGYDASESSDPFDGLRPPFFDDGLR